MPIAKILAAGLTLLALPAVAPRAAEPDSAIWSLVDAEKAFSAYSVEHGARAAFLTYLAEDAVIFRPEPIPARPFYAAQDEAQGQLKWQPAVAEVSLDGDLGYTTGPWEYRADPKDEEVGRYGDYVSLWQRRGGAWTVVMDVGVMNDAPESETPAFPELIFRAAEQRAALGALPAAAARDSLMGADRALAADAAARGLPAAVAAVAGDGLRLYRMARYPILDPAEIAAELGRLQGVWSWEPAEAVVAGSGDLGFTYGVARLSEAGSGRVMFRYSYLRIWRWEAGRGWTVVLDLNNAIPPHR
jgi:ketosteroid isomerase-like protein